jgi:hypothetical protein
MFIELNNTQLMSEILGIQYHIHFLDILPTIKLSTRKFSFLFWFKLSTSQRRLPHFACVLFQSLLTGMTIGIPEVEKINAFLPVICGSLWQDQ